MTLARSAGERLRSAARALPTGNGSEGCASTGAATESSTIIASAKPPVKHMPRAPTPGPPSSACSSRASERSQSAIGEVWCSRILLNSRLMQACRSELTAAIGESDDGTFPNRCGITTVQPRPTTSSENATTSSVIPGISEITTTPGPLPLRYVGWVTPLAVCSPRIQSSRTLMGGEYGCDADARR